VAQVIYVSGRKREAGEMNGKSGNINNCCAQIYPRGVKIPSNELVCIFDADQARHWPGVAVSIFPSLDEQCAAVRPRNT
jgi:hypothetical protein